MSLSIDKKTIHSIHFIGIFGSGMSALAQFCTWEGAAVSGSDRLSNKMFCSEIKSRLEKCGCRITPQDGSGITQNTDAIVISTAIEQTNSDIVRAKNLGLTVIHRTDLLSSFVKSYRTIAVAGTSGKSTVTAMIFHILAECNMSPSLITGANLQSLKENGLIGNAFKGKSDILVIEADESDGSLVKYSPYLSLFLNISRDHKSIVEIITMFQKLALKSKQCYINSDEPKLKKIKHTGTFGTKRPADFFAEKVIMDKYSSGIHINGIKLITPFPGRHSAENLLASVCACSVMNCKIENLSEITSSFKGVERRFNVIRNEKTAAVIDDYAHNPAKIRAAVSTVQNICRRAFILFQPHGFTPTKFMFNELVDLFNEIIREKDTLILLPVYYAGGSVNKDISSQSIADNLHSCKGDVLVPATRKEIPAFLGARSRPGDIILSMGARDPSLAEFARVIADNLNIKPD